MNHKVCVTGLGVITAIGHGKKNFWINLLAGKSGVSKIEGFDTQAFNNHFGGEVKDFHPLDYGIKPESMGRCSQLAVAATQLAIEDAALKHFTRSTAAVVLGTTLGETQVIETIDKLWLEGEDKISDILIRQFPTNNIANHVADFFQLKGTNMIIPNACAAGNFAISYAYDLIKTGKYDVVVAGGAEAMSKIAFTGFNRIFAIAPEKCQPFDVNRRGIIVSEGAGIMILESEHHAKARHANIYCHVKGYGLSADAKSMVIPDEEGIYLAIDRALKHADIKPEEVDFICAHGTGTRANDLNESKAVARIFGDGNKSDRPYVTSIKSMLGHTMGAASAIESIACVLSISDCMIPPTINLEQQDPECVVSCVVNVPKKINVNNALNNAFAFGGNNSCVVFSKAEDAVVDANNN